MGHADRTHALLSASSAHRWINCTPSARLEEQFPDTTSEAAAEGTLAHELSELKLKHYFQTVEFGRTKYARAVNKLKKSELWQDEMDGYTDLYLDYVKEQALSFPNLPTAVIEKRVDFSRWVPDGFGTADCILISGGTIHVIDFKYGKSPDGRVNAEGNPQMALYALGAYEAYKMFYPVKDIRMSIVQPRLPDGISEWGGSLDELLAYGDYVKKRAELAAKGEGEFRPGDKTCRYCRARGRCRARADKNVELAFFTDKKPELLGCEELGEYLKKGTDVSKWLSDLQDTALKECLAGRDVPGWKAVEGRGSREWTDMDQAFEALTASGIPDELLWERKALTLAQVEKTVGKKAFEETVGNLVIKKPGKPTLVVAADKRPAITNRISAADVFKKEN